MSKNTKILNELYLDPKIGFTGVNKFHEKLKQKDINIDKKELENWYNSLSLVQVTKPYRKPKKYSSIVAHYVGQIFQIDLMIYDRFKFNKYQYILCVVDVYSRYAEARALTNRKTETILEKLKEIFDKMGIPDEIQCDNEFDTKMLANYYKEHGIKVTFSLPEQPNKNAIVERFNGTLANLLQKIRIGTNNYNWPVFLKDAIQNYNTTIHSTTKETPQSIFSYKKRNRQKINIVINKFKVGDKVRLVRKKKVFTKGDAIKMSKDVYIVENVKGDKITVNGIQRTYKPYEVVSVADIVDQPIEEPKTEIQKNKVERLWKREDLQFENILPTRTRNNKIKIID